MTAELGSPPARTIPGWVSPEHAAGLILTVLAFAAYWLAVHAYGIIVWNLYDVVR